MEKALIEYVYASKLTAELETWDTLSARMLAEADTGSKDGAMTILEHNDISLQALAARDELDASRVELASALAALRLLNRGKARWRTCHRTGLTLRCPLHWRSGQSWPCV